MRNRLRHRVLGALLLAHVLGSGQALAQPAAETVGAAPHEHFSISEDGQLVFDLRAKLAWPRCAEGMQWNGATCLGKAKLFTHGEAMSLATKRWKSEGIRWRVPRANELRRLVDKDLPKGGMHPQWFPAAPREWHWSSTANIRTVGVNAYSYSAVQEGRVENDAIQMLTAQGWAVNMVDGKASGDFGKTSRLPVRLVRPLPDKVSETLSE